jgi:glycosyltransferase involved in cell wall biosynthesis
METPPKISVLVPTYNREDTIVQSLSSIFNQTIPPYEVIVIDDGSSDNTNRILEDFPQKHSNFLFIHQENAGKSAALNRGLPLASGNFIAFNDSDDLWKTDKLEKQLIALERFPECEVCFTDTTYGDEGETTTLQLAKILLTSQYGELENAAERIVIDGTGIMMQTLLVRAPSMVRAGPFDEILKVAQDTDFIMRLSLSSRFCYVNEPLVILDRVPSRSRLTTDFDANSIFRLEQQKHLHSKWRSYFSAKETSTLLSLATVRYCDTLSALSNSYLKISQFENAKASLEEAFQVSHNYKYKLKKLFINTFPKLSKRLLPSD